MHSTYILYAYFQAIYCLNSAFSKVHFFLFGFSSSLEEQNILNSTTNDHCRINFAIPSVPEE